jgi:hypothetical protein
MYDYENERLVAAPDDDHFLAHAVELANWPWLAYRNEAYCAAAACEDHPKRLNAKARDAQPESSGGAKMVQSLSTID